MAWISQVPDDEATGPLKRQYDAAMKRSGRVWNIVRIMSASPATLEASIRFYVQIMMGDSPLTRVQRELLATVVSAEVGCRY